MTNRARFHQMARLYLDEYAAQAAELLERELAANPAEPYASVVHRLLLESTNGGPVFGDGLKRRIVCLLAVETLLAFIPELATQLEGAEALLDAPEGRQ